MAKNTIADLRDHLFETLEMLKDAEKPMEIERAIAVSKVAHTIIESAKVEVKFLDAAGREDSKNSTFFEERKPPALGTGVPRRTLAS